MKKNNLLFLILFIFIIISSKTFASNKNIQEEFVIPNKLKLYEKELINKINTKEWIETIDYFIKNTERKISIQKDYLKLIKIFPSNKNIKSANIDQKLKKYRRILSSYVAKKNALKNLYKFLTSEEYFDIYIVIYNLKNLNDEKSDDQFIKFFTLCSLNSNYDERMITFRKNLLYVFNFLSHEGFPSYKNSIKDYKAPSEKQLHKIVCNEFQKKKWLD